MHVPLLVLHRVQTGNLWSHASLDFLQASQAARRDIVGQSSTMENEDVSVNVGVSGVDGVTE